MKSENFCCVHLAGHARAQMIMRSPRVHRYSHTRYTCEAAWGPPMSSQGVPHHAGVGRESSDSHVGSYTFNFESCPGCSSWLARRSNGKAKTSAGCS